MVDSSDGKFNAQLWLNTMPVLQMNTSPCNSDAIIAVTVTKQSEENQTIPAYSRKMKRSNSFLLSSGVDFPVDGSKNKDDDGSCSDVNSDSSQDLIDAGSIGTELHDFIGPAVRPIGSLLARDIRIDLMRFRSSGLLSSRKESVGWKTQRTPRVLPAIDGHDSAWQSLQSEILPAMSQTPRFPPSNPMAADNAKKSEEETPSSAAGIRQGGERIKRKTMTWALHSWRKGHSATMLQKQKIIDQYFGCCAYMKRSPFLKTQLRRFLIRPSTTHIDISGCGITGKDITAILCSFAGRGCGLKRDRVKCVQEVCDSLGDSCLASIDLCGNSLGADGAAALANSLLQADFFRLEKSVPNTNCVEMLAALTELDLSRNAFGIAGSSSIENLLAAPRCTLSKLSLFSNMLADPGCAAVARALCANTSLKVLNLAENGAANASGHAIGLMLEKNRTLEELNIAYNHLRGNGAKRIGSGLAKNRNLKKLDLQWNGFGDEETISELARALPSCVLESLDLTSNRIKLKGASILASSLELGGNIRELILDKNMIGQIGARLISRAVQEAAGRQEFPMSVSTVDCGTHIVDREAFDPCETAGAYELNVADTYDRSVLSKLMRIAMNRTGSFAAIKSNGKPTQFNATVNGANAKICDNGSIDIADWGICTANGVNLPLTEELDGDGQAVPLSKTWAKLLGRREEDVSCVVCFAFNNDRKRATLNDCLSQRNYELLESSFADPTVSAETCVEFIDTIFGSDTFISITQMEALLKILCDQRETARHAELSKVRISFVARCFHKLVHSSQNINLVDKLTSIEERKAVEKALGSVS